MAGRVAHKYRASAEAAYAWVLWSRGEASQEVWQSNPFDARLFYAFPATRDVGGPESPSGRFRPGVERISEA